MFPRARRNAFACRDVLATLAMALGVGTMMAPHTSPEPLDRPSGPAVAETCVMIVAPDSHASGSIISPDGLVLTNYHAVASRLREAQCLDEPATLPVRLGRFDGDRTADADEALVATVLASDPARDLALLKIDLPDGHAPLSHARLAERVRVGEPVRAVGCPRNAFPFMIKSGSVAGLGSLDSDRTSVLADSARRAAGFLPRPTPPSEIAVEALSTTVVLAPGDSGGPLLNARGELVGLNLASPADDPASVSFHVSVGELRAFLAEHLPSAGTLAVKP